MHQPQVDVRDLKSPQAHLQALEGWFVAVILAPVLCGDENIFTLEFSFGHLVCQAAAIIGHVRTTLRRQHASNYSDRKGRAACPVLHDSRAYCSFCLLVVINESRVDGTVSKIQSVPDGPLRVLRIFELCASKGVHLVSAPATERDGPAALYDNRVPCRFPAQPTASARPQGAQRSHGSRQSLAWRTAPRGQRL